MPLQILRFILLDNQNLRHKGIYTFSVTHFFESDKNRYDLQTCSSRGIVLSASTIVIEVVCLHYALFNFQCKQTAIINCESYVNIWKNHQNNLYKVSIGQILKPLTRFVFFIKGPNVLNHCCAFLT